MFNLNLGKKLGAAAIIALGAMSSAQAVVLDSFDYTASLSVNTGAPVAQQQFNDINAYNGDVKHTLVLNSAQGSAFTSEEYLSSLSVNNSSTGFSTLVLAYSDYNGNAFGPLDLLSLGNYFYFTTASSDANFGVNVKIIDTSAVESNFNFISTESLVPSTTLVAFNGFVGAADFSSVGAIIVTLQSNVAKLDLTLTEFGVVPEPTTLAIFGLGLLGLGLSRRRQA